MKQFLRLLLAAGVLAFAASMMAVSCGKVGDNNNNNNNNNNANNSGGGGTPQPPGPPAIVLTNFDANAAKLVAATTTGALDTIRIKGSAFPTAIVLNGIGASIRNVNAPAAPAGSIKHIFDITITGGNAGEATGGLIMVGGGNIGKVEDFSDQTTGINDEGSEAIRKEGYSSGTAGSAGANGAAGVFLAGWRHRGIFLNNTAPTTAGADTAPFAFTPSGGSQPGMFCLATITTITNRFVHPPATTTLAGGQTAKCYIVSKGAAFTGGTATTWLNTAASATFKKTFNIAIGGFRTDAKTIVQFMPGATDNAKVLALDNGLSGTEIAEIIKTNPSAYRKVSVTIVSDANF